MGLLSAPLAATRRSRRHPSSAASRLPPHFVPIQTRSAKVHNYRHRFSSAANDKMKKRCELKQQEQDGLWDKNQAARFIRIGVRTLEEKMRTRQIPYIKLGGTVRFHPDVLRDYMKSVCCLGGQIQLQNKVSQ